MKINTMEKKSIKFSREEGAPVTQWGLCAGSVCPTEVTRVWVDCFGTFMQTRQCKCRNKRPREKGNLLGFRPNGLVIILTMTMSKTEFACKYMPHVNLF